MDLITSKNGAPTSSSSKVGGGGAKCHNYPLFPEIEVVTLVTIKLAFLKKF
jgi:hypothetical protein